MPLKWECPRCKQALAVPRKKVGGYVSCPRCGGRLWVPEEAALATSLPGDSAVFGEQAVALSGLPGETPTGVPPGAMAGSGTVPPAPPVVAPPGRPASAAAVPGAAVPLPPPVTAPPVAAGVAAARNGAVAVPVGPVPADPRMRPPAGGPMAAPTAEAALPAMAWVNQPRHVARLITPDSAPMGIQPSPDGKLPVLHLEELSAERSAKAQGRTLPPWALAAILGASVILSIAAVILPGGGGDPAHSPRRAAIRRQIEEQFFSSFDARKPLEPYQLLLREAQQASAAGKHAEEREKYRRVLALLRTERETFQRGLTGSRQRDKELENLITELMAQ